MSRRILTQAPNPNAAPPVSTATRRDVFGTMGALLLLTATEAGTAKAVELDSELLECCAEAAVLEARAKALTKGIQSSGCSPEWEAADAMMKEGLRPPRTRNRVAGPHAGRTAGEGENRGRPDQ